MRENLHVVEADGIRVVLDLELGQLADFTVWRDGYAVSPFARVPWADAGAGDPRFPADMPPHLRRMSGDFFCAPFAADDVEGAPIHGWTANSAWDVIDNRPIPGGRRAEFRLRRRIAGAVVKKIWTLLDHHPFLYQRHSFIGGTGRIPVAHHTMIDLKQGGVLAFSAKSHAETPATALEPSSVLNYPARSENIDAFPSRTGPVDLTRYPIAPRHEDFVMLVDCPGAEFGWSTALRAADGDAVLLIKPITTLPQTMLWFSNGGRDDPPWCGESTGVLGIEEACSYGLAGRQCSSEPNVLSEAGSSTSIDLAKSPEIHVNYAMGAIPWSGSSALRPKIGATRISVEEVRIPFRADLLRMN